MSSIITTYSQFLDQLNSLIVNTPSGVGQGDIGLKRTKSLLSYLGDPQEKLPVIHIAGTSGKGSTAYFISSLLVAHGFRVGLHFKPHVYDVRERFQINGALISEEKTVSYANRVWEAVEKVKKQTSYGTPTYFEIIVAIAYLVFSGEKVDFAVIETGMGGLYDGTNVVENPSKTAVITRLGIDHTNILGHTKEEIAYQKAKIIQPGNTVISLFQDPVQRKVIEKVAHEAGSTIAYVKKNITFKSQSMGTSVCFDFSFQDLTLNGIRLHTSGEFQIENAALALTTLCILSKKYGFPLSAKTIRETLDTVQIIGRYQKIQYKDSLVILDGAHNTQKMKAFLTSLSHDYPRQKFVFIVAIKEQKDSARILKQIGVYAKEIILTTFEPNKQDIRYTAQSPKQLSKQMQKATLATVTIKEDPYEAFAYATKHDKTVVVTGSLYLVSEILAHFFHQVDNTG